MLSRTDLEITNYVKRTMVLYYSTDYLCFQYKGYVARLFNYFFGKTFCSQDTSQAHAVEWW